MASIGGVAGVAYGSL